MSPIISLDRGNLTVHAYHTDPKRVVIYQACDEVEAQHAAEDQLAQGAGYVSVKDTAGKTVMSWGAVGE